MELSGYFGVLRRWWWTLIVAVWVAGLAGFLLGSQIPPTYETRVRLLVGPINTDIETLRAAGQLVQTYSELTTSQPLLDSVTRELSLPLSTSELRARIRATADDVTRLLTIRVTDEDPERAVDIASTLSDELIQLAAGGTTRPEGELQTVDFPETPTTPIAPQLSLIVLLAALGGLVTAVIVILLLEYLSDSMRTREELEHLVPAPFLGRVAIDESLATQSNRRLPSDGPSAATYRQDLAKIERATGGSVRTIAMFGPTGQPEVSDAVVAQAVAIAEAAPRVTIVDIGGDLSRRLDLADRAGLRDWLADPSRPIDDFRIALTGDLSIVTSGAGGAIEAIGADQVERLRDQLLEREGSIVIAGGSLDVAPAGVVPAAIADAVIIVAVRDRTRRSELRRLAENLRLVGARLAGSLLMEPGDRASRERSAAIRPARPAPAPTPAVVDPRPTQPVRTTRRRRRST